VVAVALLPCPGSPVPAAPSSAQGETAASMALLMKAVLLPPVPQVCMDFSLVSAPRRAQTAFPPAHLPAAPGLPVQGEHLTTLPWLD